jgi:8-oxo-dGTP pyrophosphatase MutT (NUDIX family)
VVPGLVLGTTLLYGGYLDPDEDPVDCAVREATGEL